MHFHKGMDHKISNQSHPNMFFFVKLAKASERKCPQSSEAPPEPQFYALKSRPVIHLWRNLHMFLDILEFEVVNKKLFRENCFENMVS